MNALHTTWSTPAEERWAARVLLRLVGEHDVPGEVARAAVAEARLACLDSGQSPVELFGEAEEYAAEVAEHRVPEEWRASADLDGAAPTDRVTMLLLGVGWIVSVASVVLFVASGWSVDLTHAGIRLVLGGLVATGAIVWGLAVRQAGHVRQSWAWAALAAAGLAVAGSAATLSSSATVLRLPVVVVLALGIGLLTAGMRTTFGARVVDEAQVRAASPEQWFDRLAGLLRGRFYMTRAEVQGYVSDARTHWADSGSAHPVDEFGTPDVYALRLAESTGRPAKGRDRVHAWFWTFVAVTWLGWLVSDIVSGDIGGTWLWRVPGLIFFTLVALGAWRALHTEGAKGLGAQA